MLNDKDQEEKDKVTIGQIRNRHLNVLEKQIVELGHLIRKGYHNQTAAQTFLKDDIGRTLTVLDNLNSFASTEILFPQNKEK